MRNLTNIGFLYTCIWHFRTLTKVRERVFFIKSKNLIWSGFNQQAAIGKHYWSIMDIIFSHLHLEAWD